MFLLINKQNIIIDAVSTVHYKRLQLVPTVEMLDCENAWEATGIVGSNDTIYTFINANLFNIPNAVYCVGEFELPEDFKPNEFIFDPETTQIQPLYDTPIKKREHAYDTEAIIPWNEEMITITKASELWQYYHSEENIKYKDLEELIIIAKRSIREKYPD